MKFKENDLDQLEALVDGLTLHLQKYSSWFAPFGSEVGWINYYPKGNLQSPISIHLNDKESRYVYISYKGVSAMYWPRYMNGWHPWHKKTKRTTEVFKKLKHIIDTINGSTPIAMEEMFPELAQKHLEDAVWSGKDES